MSAADVVRLLRGRDAAHAARGREPARASRRSRTASASTRDFLASMIAGLTDADRPRLAELGTRDRDDFSIALLDAWAVAADVLAFYNERLAQESYLRTARERISLQELGRLIGYRLRPGVAAETYLAFALEPPPDVPAAATKDPGSAPPVTPAVGDARAGPARAEHPRPGRAAADVRDRRGDRGAARVERDRRRRTTRRVRPGLGDTHAYLKGAALNLKPGDALLFAGADIDVAPEHWDLRILATVEADADERPHARRRGTSGSARPTPHVDPANPPQPFVLRKRLDVFGHNAPRGAMQRLPHYYPGDAATGRLRALARTSRQLRRPRRLASRRRRRLVGRALDADATASCGRSTSVTELSRAAVRGLRQGHAARARGRRELRPLRRPGARDDRVRGAASRSTLAEAPDATDVEGDDDRRRRRRLGDAAGPARCSSAARRPPARSTPRPSSSKAVAAGRRPAGGSTLDGDLSTAYERGDGRSSTATSRSRRTARPCSSCSARAARATPFQRFTLAHEPLTYLPVDAAIRRAPTRRSRCA